MPAFAANLRHDLLGTVVLFTVSFGLGFTINQFQDHSLPLAYEPKAVRLEKALRNLSIAPTAPPAEIKTALPATVSKEELQSFQKEKAVLVLDARPEIFHRLGHIPGALSLSRDDFENAYLKLKGRLESDKSQPIIVYCSSVSCEDAGLVQKSLASAGYSNVAIFPGGWAEWEQAGWPQEAQP